MTHLFLSRLHHGRQRRPQFLHLLPRHRVGQTRQQQQQLSDAAQVAAAARQLSLTLLKGLASKLDLSKKSNVVVLTPLDPEI